ncbi:MAG: hypothetical protein K0B81_05755 [Candidatus Cloacimonetes bacterium]|nr:hypothetical protein [Candidatus Cloacimonadota bacterium]
MTDYNPPEVLISITKIKYQKAIIPILIVLGVFIIELTSPIQILRYISLLAFIYYLYLIIIYRINKSVGETEDKQVLSPIHGKVVKIENHDNEIIVIILKNFYQPADIRFSSDNERERIEDDKKTDEGVDKRDNLSLSNQDSSIKWTLNGKSIYYFPRALKRKSVLAGIITGKGICHFQLTQDYSILVKLGQKVEAGITAIGAIE